MAAFNRWIRQHTRWKFGRPSLATKNSREIPLNLTPTTGTRKRLTPRAVSSGEGFGSLPYYSATPRPPTTAASHHQEPLWCCSVATSRATGDVVQPRAALHCNSIGAEKAPMQHRLEQPNILPRVLHYITGDKRHLTALRPPCCIATLTPSSPTSHVCCIVAPAMMRVASQCLRHR